MHVFTDQNECHLIILTISFNTHLDLLTTLFLRSYKMKKVLILLCNMYHQYQYILCLCVPTTTRRNAITAVLHNFVTIVAYLRGVIREIYSLPPNGNFLSFSQISLHCLLFQWQITGIAVLLYYFFEMYLYIPFPTLHIMYLTEDYVIL